MSLVRIKTTKAQIELTPGKENPSPNDIIPLPSNTDLYDLGAGYYCVGSPAVCYQGGLYENGTNVVPTDHAAVGFQLAAQVTPINGSIGMISIGMSNAALEFGYFIGNDITGNGAVNPLLKVVNTASGEGPGPCDFTVANGPSNTTCKDTFSGNAYDYIEQNFLTPAGLTANQVEVIWYKFAVPISPTIPITEQPSLPATKANAYVYEGYIGGTMRAIKQRFPNIKMVFFASRIYGGYNQSGKSPEPYAYETGFTMQFVIQAQVLQADRGGGSDPVAGALGYDVAPWMAWGPYIWANGEIPDQFDGLAWCAGTLSPLPPCNGTEQDFEPDLLHPSVTGQAKVAAQLWDFFSSSQFTQGWFLNPGVILSPPSLGFGNQNLGTTSASQTVTLNNTGSSTVTIASIATTPRFTETDNCGGSIASGGSCTINVTFSPTIIGTVYGTLTVTDNNNGVAGSTQTVSLSGTGVSLAVSVSPISLNVGHQLVGTTSPAQPVTLTNNGSQALTITSIVASAGFAEANNCGTSLAAGASCTINVTFTPSASGTFTGTITITDNAPGSPQSVVVTGAGITTDTVAPTSLTFANQSLGTTSAAKVVTVKNTGKGALTFSSITTSGDFAETDNCTGSIAAGKSCAINVTFTPTATGTRTGTLTMTDDTAASPQTVSLTGTGAAQVTLSPATLTYNQQKVGTTSAAKSVMLTNNLTTPLTINSITFMGANPGDFASPTNTCGGSLAAKSNCTISVTFTPGATGTRTATLNVNDSANTSPQTVALTGTGK